MERLRPDDGFTIIEVLVAALILVVGLLAMFQMVITADHAIATNRVRQQGTSLARELLEDSRSLAYTKLTPSGIASALQSQIYGAGTASGATLPVTRYGWHFNATFTACSLDDPSDGYGDHSSPPNSGGSWCPDVAASGTQDSSPDDYKRVSVTVAPTGARTTPTVQNTILINAPPTSGPAVTCLSTTSSCPGGNQSVTSGTSLTFNVTTSTTVQRVQWLVDGSQPPAAQIPTGNVDPYVPSGTASSFTWNYPSADGRYTITALALDQNGNTGSRLTLQVSVNRHQAIAPASVTAGWNSNVQADEIQWVPSVDQDLLYYRVYHQYGNNAATVVPGCSNVTGTSCTDFTAGQSPNPPSIPATCTLSGSPALPQSYTTTNYYWVVGVDTDPTTGNPRESTQLSTKADANLCDHPPNAPTGLGGTISNGALSLTWNAPSPADPDTWDSIQHWRIYRWPKNQSSLGFASRYDVIGALNSQGGQITSFTDTSPDPGGAQQTYCVTSVDTRLNESSCSTGVAG
jgi:type II secretory pathway pseudopilin PulG